MYSCKAVELQVPVKADERWDGLGGGGGRDRVEECDEAIDRTEPVGDTSRRIVLAADNNIGRTSYLRVQLKV
jgi:hypothetical protein